MVTWKTKEGISWMESVIFSFFIPWGLRVPMWNMDFYSRVLRLSKLPRCKERPKTAICCSTWLGRWKCLGTNLDASVIPFCSWRRCLWNRSTSRLPVSLKYRFFAICTRYAKVDIGGGTGEMIGDLNDCLDADITSATLWMKRWRFASCARALKITV